MIIGGVLGPVKAYFGTVESQDRGSLHLHLLIWLDINIKPTDMKEKVQDPNFRERLIAYLENIIKQDLDDFKDIETQAESVPSSSHTSSRLTTDSLYAALRTMDITNLE
ncbi:unnamed protein product, partial [Adineta ricciae]